MQYCVELEERCFEPEERYAGLVQRCAGSEERCSESEQHYSEPVQRTHQRNSHCPGMTKSFQCTTSRSPPGHQCPDSAKGAGADRNAADGICRSAASTDPMVSLRME